MSKEFSAQKIVGILIVSVSLLGCNGGIKGVMQPSELSKLLDESDGWAMLPIPDSKYKPGTLINATDQGVRYVGNFEECGIPQEILKLVPGQAPKVTFSKATQFGAEAVANIKGVDAGIGFNKLKWAQLSVEEQGADALDLIRLSVWMTNPENSDKIPAVCLSWLEQPNTYLINEAFRISKGKYLLFDTTGAKVVLTNAMLKEFFDIGGNAKVGVTSDGELEFTETVYLAVRKARRAGSGLFETLGSPSPPGDLADPILKRLAQ